MKLFNFFDSDDFTLFSFINAKSERQAKRALNNRLYQFFIFARYYKNLRADWLQYKKLH